MGRQRWKTVQLPEELLRRVDEIVGHPEFGYSSRSEFIKDAVRHRLEELERLLGEKG